MVTELKRPTVKDPEVIRQLAKPSRLTEYSPETLRQARIALGEYARTSRIYDPVEVLAFTQSCIEEAAARLGAEGENDGDAFVEEVLRVTSEICGVCKSNKGRAMEPSATKSELNDVVPAAATESFVAIVAGRKPLVAVPEAHKRAMPSQPLGELPDIRPVTLWSSFVQVIRRATSSLLTSMFARSD